MTSDQPTGGERPQSGPIAILLVEDNPIDVKAALRAARQLEIVNQIEVAETGEAALDRIRQTEGAAPPDLVLLDLDLPGKHGLEVLAELKSDPALRRIPVVILTTSAADTDIAAAYDLGANAYVTKPLGLDAWRTLARQIEGFWFGTAQLPPG